MVNVKNIQLIIEQKKIDSETRYKYLKITNNTKGRAVIPITHKISSEVKQAYDADDNLIIDEQECAVNEGYWGNEIEFLNATFDQQNKNRRVKIEISYDQNFVSRL